ncbi:uncharacterized protein LOC130932578 [Arachis stenosperma]|uniref:uncharacterized protein LOC130932578 n=1 Tax=Arachis stenosperma TaxID=217475 RepID=UPI0025AD01C6|nr:uncharacterized protein LOC130932578 [Arachis stenosperma]
MKSLTVTASVLNPTNQTAANKLHFFHSHSLSFSLFFPHTSSNLKCHHQKRIITACSSSSSSIEIDMVKNNQGIYTPKHPKVVVLWDLDNKPPRGPPYDAARSLTRLATHLGHVVDISAYANRHTFIHLPQWVLQDRRQRKHLDMLERKGLVVPSEPYRCSVCGRKCRTNLDLKKHFRQLHERERQKKLNRMRSLKGKKRQRFKERFIEGNEKYNEAARSLIRPKIGYGLASELRRAGVYVKTVEDKPQAADWALKRQMQHSMTRGIDWLVLVSDDSDFAEMLRRAKERELGTVVVGDWDRALGRQADLWFPWIDVENGNVSEKDLVIEKNRSRARSDGFVVEEDDDGFFSLSRFDSGAGHGSSDLDELVDELAAVRTDFTAAISDEDEDNYMLGSSEDEYIEDYDEDSDQEDDGFY